MTSAGPDDNDERLRRRIQVLTEQRDTARKQRDAARKQRDQLSAAAGAADIQPSAAWIDQLPMDVDAMRWTHHESTVLILTHQKAGTHYIRFFLANYLSLLMDPQAAVVDYDELERMMPNVRMHLLSGARRYVEPATFERFGFREVMYTHVADRVRLANDHLHVGRKIIAIRNPLDYLVSIWHYNYRQRPGTARHERSLQEVLPYECTKYAAQVTYLRRTAAQRPQLVYCTAYESLMAGPELAFGDMVEFLGLPVHSEQFALALSRSRFDQVRTMEERRGAPLVADIDGWFTRSGKVGQWREHLTSEQVEQVRAILSDYDLDLEEFTLDT